MGDLAFVGTYVVYTNFFKLYLNEKMVVYWSMLPKLAPINYQV